MDPSFYSERLATHSLPRRQFLKMAAMLAAAGIMPGNLARALADDKLVLPFAHGERRLVSFPEKRPLLLLRTRPPLLETPFSVFDQGVFTPNDAFYVRWHLDEIPTEVNVEGFRLLIRGEVKRPLTISLQELVNDFKPVEIAAVNQCSGNSRGFFSPRVPGGQWGSGAMGNALWTGVPLKVLLEKAGVRPGAVAVRFDALDHGTRMDTPDYLKSLSLEHAMDGEVMVAYGMNGAPLPVLNGFPLRLVVPGWYATYWVKALFDIEVLDHPDDNFWMTKAYKIPDTPHANMRPGQKGVRMVPIGPMVPRSFITWPESGAKVKAGQPVKVRGIAFGGAHALAKVLFSADGGKTWAPAQLGRDYGKYSFRRWEAHFTPPRTGSFTLMARAFDSRGDAQTLEPNWNPGGYMRNVVEPVHITAI